MKIQKNQMLEKAINTLYTELQTKQYGTQFSWEELKKLSGNTQLTKEQLYYITVRVNKLLMTHNTRYMQTSHGIGKRIINPTEHSAVARKTVRKSARIYKQGARILGATNMDMLTQEERQKIIEDANKFTTLEMFTSELLKQKKLTVDGFKEKKDVRMFLDVLKLFKNEKS